VNWTRRASRGPALGETLLALDRPEPAHEALLEAVSLLTPAEPAEPDTFAERMVAD
jgi:hypothetical protein